MDILKKLVYIILTVFILTGCYSDFNPDEYSRPVLCLNSVISAGQTVEVSVTRTWRYNDDVDAENRQVKDAQITIYVNGHPQSHDYIVKEGDEIHIIAESAEYGSAEASVIVPFVTPIEGLEFIPYGVRAWKSVYNEYTEQDEFECMVYFNFEVRLKIEDNQSEKNYFRMGGNEYSLGWSDSDDEELSRYGATLNLGELDYNSDMIFKEHIGIIESVFGGSETTQMFFTDNMFSGSDYTLSMIFDEASFYACGPEFEEEFLDCGVKFTLLTVSESYYNRMNYLWQKDSGRLGELTDLGLADPIWGYSNVSTGAGVVVAKTAYTFELNLRDFIKNALEEAIEF